MCIKYLMRAIRCCRWSENKFIFGSLEMGLHV